ncbi:unnamed protein product [Rhizophagus irregularis]|nr:unnamed protein product [Rhizophagus irregularis]
MISLQYLINIDCKLQVSAKDKTINHLLTWILEYNDNIQDFNALMVLNIWDISYDPNVFTFIDLIKGIIPMSLSELLSSWTTKKNVVDVLIQMRQFIFNEIFEEVWIPRCSHLKEFECSMGLTKKKKLEFKSVRSLPSNNSSNNNTIHYDSLDSVKNYIYFDQIISGDKSHLLLWKEMLIKAYVHISSQRKVAKWYTDIKHLITSDGIHLNHSITQLFGAHVDNVEEAQSYNIDKKDRSLIAFYNSQ